MAEEIVAGSPAWWLKRLSTTLTARREKLARYDRYYSGEHPLAFATEKFREAFGGLFKELADNWCEVVVDAVEERLDVDGFRFGKEPEADEDAWEIWQRNQLDADSQLTHSEALVTGYGYALVWADAEGDPLITVESPQQCIVAHAQGNRRKRSAGLKQWVDDDGFALAYVYLPDGIHRFRSLAKQDSQADYQPQGELVQWQPYSPDGAEYLPNPTGDVTLVPFYNKPRLSKPGLGVSEIDKVIGIQNAVNKTVADLLVASEFGSFRQRWATGLTLDVDDKGNKVNPFRNAPGAIWADESTDPPANFGEFGETNLANIVKAIEMFVQHLASQSRTPPHYLSAAADRLSGESIKAAETGLVAKTRRKMRYFGESWEEVMRLSFAMSDDPRSKVVDAETVWADPESRTESEHVDATSKKKDLGVPWQQLMEDLDYTPPQIARMRAMRAQDALEELLMAPPLPAAPAAPGGAPANGQRPPVPQPA
jgi:hypothetical protein